MGTVENRPWGSYEVLANGDGYQVKRLTVKPGKRLSLQWHRHRGERWTVVAGTASVTLDGAQFVIRQGGMVEVQLKAVHRLANAGASQDLVVIETQVGDYLDEDDIVRVEDDFGRVAV
jgi:mannose-1-phosphate guanylyltransferase